MPKRKAPAKSTLQSEADKKEEEIVENKPKQTKKTEVVKETKIVKIEKSIETAKTKSQRNSSKGTKDAAEEEKQEKTIKKVTKKEKVEEEKEAKGNAKAEAETSAKGKRGRSKKEEKDDKEEKEERKEAKKKGKKKQEEKDEDEDEEEEDNNEKAQGKKKVKKTKVVKEEKVEASQDKKSRKLTRNRSDIADTIDDIKVVERPVVLGDGKIPGNEIIIASWNVNGLKSLIEKNHLHKYINERKPEILCLNETKLTDDNVLEKGTSWIPEGYHAYWNCCKVKKGYSGTGIVSKHKPISVKYDIGIKKHDLEGRTITLEFEYFYLVSCYVPNAGAKLEGLPYRTEEWDPDFKNYLNDLRKKKHVILCGDLNCAHKEIDIHNPKTNLKSAGFTVQERKCFTELLDSGFIDTFRHFYPEIVKFSYFNARFPSNRVDNKGWRLDYFLIDKEGLPSVKDSLINNEINGSDHLPIELKLNPQFTESLPQ